MGFRVGHVFDVSQTDGEPLPTLVDEVFGGLECYAEAVIELGCQTRPTSTVAGSSFEMVNCLEPPENPCEIGTPCPEWDPWLLLHLQGQRQAHAANAPNVDGCHTEVGYSTDCHHLHQQARRNPNLQVAGVAVHREHHDETHEP